MCLQVKLTVIYSMNFVLLFLILLYLCSNMFYDSNGNQYISQGKKICAILRRTEPPYYTLLLLNSSANYQISSQTILSPDFTMNVCFLNIPPLFSPHLIYCFLIRVLGIKYLHITMTVNNNGP